MEIFGMNKSVRATVQLAAALHDMAHQHEAGAIDYKLPGEQFGGAHADIARTSNQLVQEITAASEEQSSGVGQINSAVSQLSQTTQQNASASEELAATAEEMNGMAAQLLELTAFFKVDNANAVAPARQARAAAPPARAPGGQQRRAGIKVSGNLHGFGDGFDETNFTKY